MPRKESIVNASSAQAQQDSASTGIDAYELPKSLVTKLARAALPDNAKMQKEMLLAVMKGSTMFVNYLGANAHEVASSRQHKSVSASDVLRALEQMDMGDLVPKLQAELEVYRNNQKADKNKKGSKGKAKEGESISAGRASAKTKGKEKEKASGPTITIPKRAAASISEPSVQTKTQESELEPESETEDVQRRDVEDEDEDMLDAETYEDEIEDDGAVEEDEVEDEDEDEEGDIVDQMAIEEDELRKDAKGVEERGHGLDDD